MSVKTIKLDLQTYNMLRDLKYALRADTFAQTIRKLIRMAEGKRHEAKASNSIPERFVKVLEGVVGAANLLLSAMSKHQEVIKDIPQEYLDAAITIFGLVEFTANALRDGHPLEEALKIAEERVMEEKKKLAGEEEKNSDDKKIDDLVEQLLKIAHEEE